MSIRRAVSSLLPELGAFASPDLAGLQRSLGTVLSRGYTDAGPEGRLQIRGSVTLLEAKRIADLIVERRFTRCAETGVAYGVSTAAICLGLAKVGSTQAVHYGVDPCQTEEHKGAALHLLRELGVSHYFKLLEEPAHLGLSALIRQNVELDFAFIDGWHTLDYKLIDFFLFDKLLVCGGVIAMHDSTFQSTRSVLKYALAYRNYRLIANPKVCAPRTVQRFGHWICRRANHPEFIWKRLPNLVLMEKVSAREPDHGFYSRI